MKTALLYLGLLAAALAASQEACRGIVPDRGRPPQSFIDEVVTWAKAAPDEVFQVNANHDAFSLMAERLGPFPTLKKRRAALVHGLVIHAGRESSWRHTEGVDTSKAQSLNSCKSAEAGAYQTSFDAVGNFGGDLPGLFERSCSKYSEQNCKKFQKCAKYNHDFSVEMAARLLRHRNGWRHYGPWVRGEVQRSLSRACVAELEKRF